MIKGQAILLGIGCAFFASITASAQSSPAGIKPASFSSTLSDRRDVDRAQPLSLQQAIDLALRQASDFTTAQINERIAAEDIRQAQAALLPKFDAKPNYIYTSPSLGDVRPRPPSFLGANAINEIQGLITASGEIDTSGKLSATVKRNQALLASAHAGAAVARRNLIQAVTEAYFGFALASAKRRSAQNTLSAAEEFENNTKLQLDAGEVAPVDYTRARLQTATRRDELEQATTEESVNADSLRVFIGVRFVEPVATEDLLANMPVDNEIERFSEAAISTRPEFAQFEADRIAAEQEIQIAKADRRPQFTYSVGSGFISDSLAPTHIRDSLGFDVNVGMTIPIFDWGAAKSRETQARLKVQQAENARALAARQFAQAFFTARTQAISARTRVRQIAAAITDAEANLSASIARYRSGEATIIEVTDADKYGSDPEKRALPGNIRLPDRKIATDTSDWPIDNAMTDDNEDLNEVDPGEYRSEVPQEEHRGPDLKRPLIIGAIIVAAVGLIVLFLFFRGRTSNQGEAETKEEPVVSVKVATAEKDSISSEVSVQGSVAPAQQSTVSSTISAQIIQMQILKNALVRKGDVLAVLASQDLRAQRDEAQHALDEAKLNLETVDRVTIPQASAQVEHDLSDAKAAMDNARATYERRQDLYRKGGISLKEVEASQLAYANAQNAYRLAEKNASLNRTAVNPNSRAIAQAKVKEAQDHLNAIQAQANFPQIKAPITGIVTDQFQFQGEFASAGGKLLTIADISEVIVKAQFADTVIESLKVGDAVSVYPENAPDERMAGKVTLISRSSDPQNRTVEVWARFGNPRGLLITGGAARFVVTNETVDEAIIIPLSAVTLDAANADEGSVMVVGEDSVAHETKVKIGIKQGDKVQITEGLGGGEAVVIEGNYALPDGSKVEVAKDDEGDKKEESDKEEK